MLTASDIYWIFRCDSIHSMLSVCAVVMGILTAAAGIFALGCFIRADWDDDFLLLPGDRKDRKVAAERHLATLALRFMAGFLTAVCLLGVSKTMLPTTKELVLIKVLPAVANSKFVQEDLPKDVRKLYTAAVQSALNTFTVTQQNTKKGKEDADH